MDKIESNKKNGYPSNKSQIWSSIDLLMIFDCRVDGLQQAVRDLSQNSVIKGYRNFS